MLKMIMSWIARRKEYRRREREYGEMCQAMWKSVDDKIFELLTGYDDTYMYALRSYYASQKERR
jgi:hypothetical protein